MASAQDVQVSLEKVAHEAMRGIAQELIDKHDLRVESVQFRWACMIGKPRLIEVAVTTVSPP